MPHKEEWQKTLKELRSAIAMCRSYTAAAKEIGISRPTLVHILHDREPRYMTQLYVAKWVENKRKQQDEHNWVTAEMPDGDLE